MSAGYTLAVMMDTVTDLCVVTVLMSFPLSALKEMYQQECMFVIPVMSLLALIQIIFILGHIYDNRHGYL
jgi:hypothetical protein